MITEPLDLLRSNLSRVRIPEPATRIFKHECCLSFDTPRSEGGLFIDMSTFLAFGKDIVGFNYEETKNPVYLHIKQTKKTDSEHRPSKRPTLLAIGVDAGFDNNEVEYEETHSVVILPDYVSLPFPSVELPEKVRLAVNAILLADGAKRKVQLAAWTADNRKVSAYAMNLQQIDNGVVIPPSGWKCAKCDKKDNLWLNLTDGVMLCGRKNWDGTGGNNHAIQHYEQTGYPLAVKLGTITADLEAADVFSYPEDDSVLDPQLAQHLAFFGIDFPLSQKKQQGIRLLIFKVAIAASHPAFSSLRQQDALEFFLHFIDKVGQANAGKTELDPARSFKFGIEDRILCSSGKVTYNKRRDYILSLNIPFLEATNKGELASFQKLKAEKLAAGKEIGGDEIVRPWVPLEACLANFSAPEEIHDFYSTALKTKTTALKTAGLTSFPDYLGLHMRRFVMEGAWVPKKLDVYIDVPDIIDISHMRSLGHQTGEELLPDGAPFEEDSNESIVSQLVSMGFNHLHCQKAAINTSNVGVGEAMNWLLSHMDDPDIDTPISESHGSETLTNVDQSKVDSLISFGFQEEISRKALKASGGDIDKATYWILSNPDAVSSMDATSSNATTIHNDDSLPDGGGRYRLIGIVSHRETHCGQKFVAHVFKEGQWVILDDETVGDSTSPPKEMGYLYFYERLD